MVEFKIPFLDGENHMINIDFSGSIISNVSVSKYLYWHFSIFDGYECKIRKNVDIVCLLLIALLQKQDIEDDNLYLSFRSPFEFPVYICGTNITQREIEYKIDIKGCHNTLPIILPVFHSIENGPYISEKSRLAFKIFYNTCDNDNIMVISSLHIDDTPFDYFTFEWYGRTIYVISFIKNNMDILVNDIDDISELLNSGEYTFYEFQKSCHVIINKMIVPTYNHIAFFDIFY